MKFNPNCYKIIDKNSGLELSHKDKFKNGKPILAIKVDKETIYLDLDEKLYDYEAI